jgi:hypothetical protein
VTAGAYGSSVARMPGRAGLLYGLTDRGPDVDHPDGTKVEPLPGYVPRLGRFRPVGGRAVLERQILLRDRDGTAFTGRPNCTAGDGGDHHRPAGCGPARLAHGVRPRRTGRGTGRDLLGRRRVRPLPAAPGPDRASDRMPVALRRFIARCVVPPDPEPGDGRIHSHPDGTTLVGAMQPALNQPALNSATSAVPVVRLVSIDLRSRTVREYLYLLDDPRRSINGVSEITALSNTVFLVVERSRTAPVAPSPGPHAPFPRVFRVALDGATDVGPGSPVPGARYDAGTGGLFVGDRSLEAGSGATDPGTAAALLADVGVTL